MCCSPEAAPCGLLMWSYSSGGEQLLFVALKVMHNTSPVWATYEGKVRFQAFVSSLTSYSFLPPEISYIPTNLCHMPCMEVTALEISVKSPLAPYHCQITKRCIAYGAVSELDHHCIGLSTVREVRDMQYCTAGWKGTEVWHARHW